MSTTAADRRPSRGRTFVAAVASELYVLVVAGIATGVVVVGIGSRLAMFALRLTSPASVDGVQSDDDFTIGRFTLSGSYNLVVIGGLVGVVGAAAYQWVRPWLIGPRWFRLVTVAAAAGAVVGSMLVHADGIDFTLLEPMWFAVALFVALPAAFAVSIAAAVDTVERRLDTVDSAVWRRCAMALVLVAFVPPVLMLLAVATVVLLPWVLVRDDPSLRTFLGRSSTAAVARIAWLAIAAVGLVALVNDIVDLRSITS